MADLLETQRQWLDDIRRRFHVNIADIARRAGVAYSTVNRLYRGQVDTALSARTVDKIMAAFGVGPPGGAAAGPLYEDCTPVAAREIRALAEQGAPALARLAEILEAGPDDLSLWRVTSGALAQAGYLPGDYVVVNAAAGAARGHPVLARADSIDVPGTRHLLRIYDPPFLLAPSADPHLRKPLALDDARITLLGVVAASFRLAEPEILAARRIA